MIDDFSENLNSKHIIKRRTDEIILNLTDSEEDYNYRQLNTPEIKKNNGMLNYLICYFYMIVFNFYLHTSSDGF